MKFINPDQHFPSHHGYFASTVSEMVHNPNSPAGKCFRGFEFIASILIFQSWYPWHLRNCYIGDDMTLPCAGCISWTTFRQLVPSTGMMIVATITITPAAQANAEDSMSVAIHLAGAVMLFGGYFVV